MPQRFPWHLWMVALRDTLRYLLSYEPPQSNEAVGGEVKIKVKQQESDEDG